MTSWHSSLGANNNIRAAFTLIELLVVIAIIAILAVVVVLTLNPAQLLAQSRDANRVSDMATLNTAINLYNTDQSGASTYSLGIASTSYLSVPSSASNCSTLGIATSAFSYACSSSSNYRNASSSGWIPVNFQNISAGAPFSNLPVDPVNQTSSNLYYSYETNGTQYVLSAFMESQKYAKNMETTGGTDPALYQIGSGANTLPDATRGLVGYWPLNEGTGSSTIDWSGYGNNGTWTGAATGTNGTYYSPGKVWTWAGDFDGSSDYVASISSIPTNNGSFTAIAWINPTANGAVFSKQYGSSNSPGDTGMWLSWNSTGGGSVLFYQFDASGNEHIVQSSLGSVPSNAWSMIAISRVMYSGNATLNLYVNGALAASSVVSAIADASTQVFTLGKYSYTSAAYYTGSMNDFRLYGRILSASEIQEIYNAEK